MINLCKNRVSLLTSKFVVRNAMFRDNHDDDPVNVLSQLDTGMLKLQLLILILQQKLYILLWPKNNKKNYIVYNWFVRQIKKCTMN